MLVVVANDLPPAVRGRMKLWFIEPRANIFVSGIKDSLAKKVVAYLHEHCPEKSGLMILCSNNTTPGYEIYGIGDTKRDFTEISGMPLVIEKQIKPQNESPPTPRQHQ
ncbi:MAG: type I-E CRISPR-associated endoribonuclease Cas2e [Candidatus Chlorobium antarcticum]|jgi:CRISPR-associated protein Cas2|nr:type I-E CRISPR-associated endoribonuclease Cas2e [Candidatus Chlorobium antarcticum]